jgi:hypothetical protein
MSKGKKKSNGAMLELWRPPKDAGDPVGCLASTYTFSPGLFDEQCLARFLEIDSEPDREDLAFLLERESRLGSVYAGVLVDFSQAGVEHSLRWDVLPVRIRAGKQHSKVSLLAWSNYIRIIIASANLTDPGYRTNREVASFVDFSPGESNQKFMEDCIVFLKRLLLFIPSDAGMIPEVIRAGAFLDQLEQHTRKWNSGSHRGETIRQYFVNTLPAQSQGYPSYSSLESMFENCRSRGGSPSTAWVASPFFDQNDDTGKVTASLCKMMARGGQRNICFCVPAIPDDNKSAVPRLAAPKSLWQVPQSYQGEVTIEILPEQDTDKNRRPWHAKMVALLLSDTYSALMTGSSNFTCAGMGVAEYKNAEANLLSIVNQEAYKREVGQIESIWPEMDPVDDPDSAEWLGGQPGNEEEEQIKIPLLPAGFLSATYRAGDKRQIILRFRSEDLPQEWCIYSYGQETSQLVSSQTWKAIGSPSVSVIDWADIYPPSKLMVEWSDHEAFFPINVEDSRTLPPPAQLEKMSADDMLWILAAADPSAAFRAWAKQQQPSDTFDSDLDSATPPDLDPLRRYDLQATFLHRIRRRARILAQLRSNLQRPVWGKQALEWRLRGLIGVEQLAERLVREVSNSNSNADEALLTLADFLIVLREVDYQPQAGALPKEDFYSVFEPFILDQVSKLERRVFENKDRISEGVIDFWERVINRCRK